MRPFVKCVGGKYRYRERIIQHLPTNKEVYVEPFLGSGAIWLSVAKHYQHSVLSDSNADLICLWKTVQTHGERFINWIEPWFRRGNKRHIYEHRRAQFNKTEPGTRTRAALFLYLNRHGFNGLCRYNKAGGYNVPFGQYKQVKFPREELLAAHFALRRATLTHCTFDEMVNACCSRDVVYCDPPYLPATNSNDIFTAYTPGGFDLTQHKLLARSARAWSSKGATVLVSNHDTKFTRKLYRWATTMHSYAAPRSVSCKKSSRKPQQELLAIYRP